MLGLIGFILSVVALVLLFLGGLAYCRWRFGAHAQQMYMAIGGLILATGLDLFWIITTVQWCTGGVKQSLRLSGSASGNRLLDDIIGRFGGVAPDSASSFGFILPVAAAALAHIGALLVVAGVQHLFLAARAQERPSRRLPSATSLRWQAAGYLVGSIPLAVLFFIFSSIDANLMRYRMVVASPALRKALGEDWSSIGWAELSERAHNSMQGMIFLHLPVFYIGFTLLTAVAAVLTIHIFLHALGTLRREIVRPYQVTPLVLAPIAPTTNLAVPPPPGESGTGEPAGIPPTPPPDDDLRQGPGNEVDAELDVFVVPTDE